MRGRERREGERGEGCKGDLKGGKRDGKGSEKKHKTEGKGWGQPGLPVGSLLARQVTQDPRGFVQQATSAVRVCVRV